MVPDEQVTEAAELAEPSTKRQRRDNTLYTGGLLSLDREISPPPLRRASSSATACSISIASGGASVASRPNDKWSTGAGSKKRAIDPQDFIDLTGDEPEPFNATSASRPSSKPKKRLGELDLVSPRKSQAKILPSPFQLTSIRDLPASENVDTVGIKDILGDVMIKEAWIFNFLVDLDWVMGQFDPDIKDIVDVKIVHGSWRNEDNNRVRLEEQSKHFSNAKIICAYMPEAFGTHHTKMIVLFRHDDLAQVIIHTSNMIPFDWTNMTQAVWRSPLLPLTQIPDDSSQATVAPLSVGQSFKSDLLAYFSAYGKGRTGDLVNSLEKYSFDDVKAVFIGSVPGKFQIDGRGKGGRWGWMGLKRILGNIPLRNNSQNDLGRIVVQISSIATLGQTDAWLSPILYKALCASRSTTQTLPPPKPKNPKLSIIFPTVEEVRDSLNGYSSGSAIHIKIHTPAQQKQLDYLRPFLCRWDPFSQVTPSTDPEPSSSSTPDRLSGRSRAAPHIKTYIRFADQDCSKIEWAMLTSANLSTQAWGSSFGNSSGRLMGHGEGEVRICSYEAGVVVYPDLFKDSKEEAVVMVPVFKKDTPSVDSEERGKVVGIRMAYDLPIKAYGEKDLPWCATMSYQELDWKGQSWGDD